MHQGGGVQWHIPQQSGGMVNGTGMSVNSSSQHHGSSRPPPQSLPLDESFKIMLKTQTAQQHQQMAQRPAPISAPNMAGDAGNKMPGGHVTSSVPKTPSPSQARVEDPEKSLDKFCQVQLMQ